MVIMMMLVVMKTVLPSYAKAQHVHDRTFPEKKENEDLFLPSRKINSKFMLYTP